MYVGEDVREEELRDDKAGDSMLLLSYRRALRRREPSECVDVSDVRRSDDVGVE